MRPVGLIVYFLDILVLGVTATMSVIVDEYVKITDVSIFWCFGERWMTSLFALLHLKKIYKITVLLLERSTITEIRSKCFILQLNNSYQFCFLSKRFHQKCIDFIWTQRIVYIYINWMWTSHLKLKSFLCLRYGVDTAWSCLNCLPLIS